MAWCRPLGAGVSHNWQRLISGGSGIVKITSFDVSDLACQVAGVVPRGDAPEQFNPNNYIELKDQKKMDTFIHFALAAADEAIAGQWLYSAGRRGA